MPLVLDWQSADTRYQINPADNLSPDKLYDRAWAVTLLEWVIGRLRDESAADGKSGLFEQLKPFLMVGKSAIPYAQAAAGLGLSEGTVRVAVHRLRRRYRELMREEIGQTLSDPAQVEEEMRALFSAFAGSRACGATNIDWAPIHQRGHSLSSGQSPAGRCSSEAGNAPIAENEGRRRNNGRLS